MGEIFFAGSPLASPGILPKTTGEKFVPLRLTEVHTISVTPIPTSPFTNCSGLMNPDINMGGKIATREVFNGKTTKIIFNRIQA